MKYRRKPVVVEAEQWFKGKNIDGVVCNPIGNPMVPDFYYVKTSNGFVEIHEGEFVITEINGEKYSCKPDIFEKTYELIEQ